MEKIPILLYHECSVAGGNAFSTRQEDFRSQLEYLHHNGFCAVSLQRLFSEWEYFKDEKKPQAGFADTRRKIVLTFDDGDRTHFDFVFPLLKGMGFSATFFVTVNDIGKEGRMDWSMIYELSRNGMDIGSHGMSHTFFPSLKPYPLLNELLYSKQVLEKYTRKRVNFISIPHGFYNQEVLTIARDAGFKAVCVSDAGYNDVTGEEVFLLKRFTMRRRYGMPEFKSIVKGRPKLFLTMQENMRTTLRRGLGYQVYDRFRNLVFRAGGAASGRI